jgi:hypothetical protein
MPDPLPRSAGSTPPSANVQFAFAFAEPYRLAALAFGVRPDNACVEVGERSLRVSYGPWLVETPLANITDVTVTGPYRFIKTAGPARLGLTDRGLTFASNGDRGVCMTFARPVWGFDRLGLIRHPNLTVTVREVERLAALLGGRADFAASLDGLAH